MTNRYAAALSNYPCFKFEAAGYTHDVYRCGTGPAVVATSMPPPMGRKRAGAIDLSDAEIACVRDRMEREDLTALGLRFEGDPMCPKLRMDNLEAAFPGHFERIDLPDASAAPSPDKPHSTLTAHRAPDGPTRDAGRRVIAFLQAATAAP